MKNSLLTGLVLMLVIGAFYAGYKSGFFNENKVDVSKTKILKPASDGSENAFDPDRDTALVKGLKVSLGGIFSVNGGYECKYEMTTKDSKTTNIANFANGKMSFELKTVTNQKTTVTFGIYDGNIVHIWAEGNKNGIKIQPKTMSDFPTVIPEEVLNAKIINGEKGTSGWRCAAWKTDESKFVLPANVIFY